MAPCSSITNRSRDKPRPFSRPTRRPRRIDSRATCRLRFAQRGEQGCEQLRKNSRQSWQQPERQASEVCTSVLELWGCDAEVCAPVVRGLARALGCRLGATPDVRKHSSGRVGQLLQISYRLSPEAIRSLT